VEILTWVLLASTETEQHSSAMVSPEPVAPPQPTEERMIIDTTSGEQKRAAVYERHSLQPGMQLDGPAVIVEQDTTTVVSARFRARVGTLGYLILEQKSSAP
jgi:N-methylhydantoinase A